MNGVDERREGERRKGGGKNGEKGREKIKRKKMRANGRLTL